MEECHTDSKKLIQLNMIARWWNNEIAEELIYNNMVEYYKLTKWKIRKVQKVCVIRVFVETRSILLTAHVPGFKIVIASNVPMKRGLGSSSALVVALYTFLEAITNTYTGNVLEKTLACHLAEKKAAYPCEVRLGDILTSVVGCNDKIFTFDAKSLDIGIYDWHSMDVDFAFIECGKETSTSCTSENKNEVLTLFNTSSRWRTHPHGDSMIQLLFSQETIEMINEIVDEDNRVERMIDNIVSEDWKELGTTC
nr:PREDICTED: uncharacterized protein LOC105663440 [Megachile rotundata]